MPYLISAKMNPTTALPKAAFIQRGHGDDLTIVYLGQVGFLLQKNGVRIVIDPYLTDSVDRMPGCPKDFWCAIIRRRLIRGN